MAVFLSPVGGVAAQFFDNSGNVLSGGKLYTYSAGTTTPVTAYTSSLGNVVWTNPIVLDAAGRVPNGGEIWLTDGVIYKFVLKTSNDVLIATYDNITGINSNFVNYTTEQEIQTATAGQTVFELADIQYTPGTNSLTVYVDGVNQYGPGAQYSYEETDSTTVTFNDGLHVGASVKFTTATQTTGNATDASVVAFTGFNGQVGTVQDLADDDGSDWIGFLQEGTGAVAISTQDKLRQSVSFMDFGAAGDGVTDDTNAIQAALDSGAKYITGDNKLYVVTTIYPKSSQIIQDARLIAKASATQVSLRPVVKIGGVIDSVVQTVADLVMRNIVINGNRQNMADIYIGAGEDGGMHGFKVADGANGIKLLNCEASYCGTAGLAIHSEGVGSSADYPIKNIYIEDFIGTYNREHGMFGDSFAGVYINRAYLSYNGQEIASGYPPENGNSPFINPGDGLPFGSGFDLECYVGYPKSYFKNFYASDVVCNINATPCMIYAPAVVDAVAEIPAQNIFVRNAHFEKGTNGASDVAFSITANSYVGEKYGVDTVQLSGYFDGYITSNNTRRVSIVDGYINAPSDIDHKALFNNGKDSAITVPSNKAYVKVETFGSPTVVKDTGAGTLTASINQLMQSNGLHTLIMPLSVSGGLISGGAMSWTVTMPTGISAISANINAYNTTSGASVVANVAIISDTEVRVFMTPTDDNIAGVLSLEILF